MSRSTIRTFVLAGVVSFCAGAGLGSAATEESFSRAAGLGFDQPRPEPSAVEAQSAQTRASRYFVRLKSDHPMVAIGRPEKKVILGQNEWFELEVRPSIARTPINLRIDAVYEEPSGYRLKVGLATYGPNDATVPFGDGVRYTRSHIYEFSLPLSGGEARIMLDEFQVKLVPLIIEVRPAPKKPHWWSR